MKDNRYGRLTVQRAATKADKAGLVADWWVCLCDCGTVSTVRGSRLRKGRHASCGCVRTVAKDRKTVEYKAWRDMRRRCENPQSKLYKYYGARGIKVCERWHQFEHFAADMHQRPGIGWSLDRIDNDMDYCPENCRWARPDTQVRNRRNSVHIEHDGERAHIAVWAEKKGIPVGTLRARIKKGWPIADVVGKSVAKGCWNKGLKYSQKRNGAPASLQTYSNKDLRRSKKPHGYKLTEDAVLSILQARSQGVTCKDLARAYNVSPALVCLVGNGKIWRHVYRKWLCQITDRHRSHTKLGGSSAHLAEP